MSRMDTLAEFMGHFQLDAGDGARRRPQALAAVTRAFARIPYENVTKIIRRAEAGGDEQARRGPGEVIAGHIRWGAGGTCFSLTSALRFLLRALGWDAEYILADRRYGRDTHSALLVWIDGGAHLLDPGYLLTEPVPLATGAPTVVASAGERLLLTPDATGGKVDLATLRGGRRVHRLTYKVAPVDDGEFGKAWDASFRWDMMRYPLLARVSGARRSYLRGSMLQVSDADSVRRRDVPQDELVENVAREFGIHPSLVARALDLLRS
jgi:arylamine N-acetyltransferase